MDVHRELAELRTMLAAVADHVEAFEAEVGADAGLSGAAPGATENRAIRRARAHLAQQRAREMREGLDRVRAQAATMAGEARSARARIPRDEHRHHAPAAPSGDGLQDDGTEARLHQAARQLAAAETRDDVLTGLVAEALRAVSGAQWAGVCDRRHDGSLHTEAAGDPVVAELVALQDALRGGPCLDVLDLPVPGAVVVVPDLARDARWPALGVGAAALGVRSLLVLRIAGPRVRRPLALLLGAREPEAFDQGARRAARVLADHALIALAGVHRGDGSALTATGRDVVGHAQGILVARHGLDPRDALDRLLRAAEQANTRLVDVAGWVVGNTVGARHADDAPDPQGPV